MNLLVIIYVFWVTENFSVPLHFLFLFDTIEPIRINNEPSESGTVLYQIAWLKKAGFRSQITIFYPVFHCLFENIQAFVVW